MRAKSLIFFVFISLIFTFFSSAVLALGDEELTLMHMPANTWYTADPLLIQATIFSEKPILRATLFYRKKDALFFEEEEMYLVSQSSNSQLSNARYQGFIPTKIRTQDGVEYYIEVLDEKYRKKTYPSFLARLNPQFVKVSEDFQTEYIQLVLPENRYNMQTLQPFFMFNYNEDPDLPIDPENLSFFLDNRNITEEINVSYFTANFRPIRPLSKGKHIIDIYEKTNEGRTLRLVTSFSIGESQKLSYKGHVSQKIYRFETSKSDATVQNEDEFSGQIETEFQDRFEVKGNALISAKEQPDLQPFNRYYVQVNTKDKNIFFKLGDANPVYSPFTLNGIQSRGFEFLYTTDAFDFAYNVGETQRGVPGNTSTNTPGTFAQELAGTKLNFNFGNVYFLGLNLIHIIDKVESISIEERGGSAPKENFVGSVTNKFLFADGTIQVNNEVAASIHYRNLEAEAEESDDVPEWVASIFEPKAGIGIDGSAILKLQMPFYFGNNIRAHISHTGSSFTTLGNSSLRTDRQEVFLWDKLYVFCRYIYMTGSFKYAHDNVPPLIGESLKDSRTVYTTINGSGGITFPGLPSITVSAMKDDKKNNVSGDTARDNTNLTLSGSLRNIGFELWGFKTNVGFNGNYMVFTDNTPAKKLPNFENISGTGTWEFSYVDAWSLSLNGGLNLKTDKSTQIVTTYRNGSGKFKMSFPEMNSRAYIKGNVTFGTDSVNALNNVKVQPAIGYYWEPAEKHSLDAKYSLLYYTDNLDSTKTYNDKGFTILYKIVF